MDQSVSLFPALLGFMSFGAVLILQRPKNHALKTLWLVSANEAYETRAFDEFHRIKREIGEGIKCFVLIDEDTNSPEHYRIELPSGRRDTIIKEWVDAAVQKKILVEVDPDTRRKQQAKMLSERRAKQIKARGWPIAIAQLVIEGKIKTEMTQEQVLIAWGKPDQIKRLEGDWAGYEQWVYGSTCLLFERRVLKNYRELDEPSKNDGV